MNGIKMEIEKLTQEVTQVFIKPKEPPTMHVFDINYYSFSHQVLHAAQMLLQCLEMDPNVRNSYKKLVSKMKQAAKCRPEQQSQSDQSLAGKDQISIFLNTRKPIVQNKDRGELYKFLTIRQQTQKDNQSFLQHMNKVKAGTLVKQKSVKPQTKQQEIQTEIAWVSSLEYRSKQQANYYQAYLRSYLEKNINITPNTEKGFQTNKEDQVQDSKLKTKKNIQKMNETKKTGKNLRQKNGKKQQKKALLGQQNKQSNNSSKKSILAGSNLVKSKIQDKMKIKKTGIKASLSQETSRVDIFKTKHSIVGEGAFNKTISEENIEFQQQHALYNGESSQRSKTSLKRRQKSAAQRRQGQKVNQQQAVFSNEIDETQKNQQQPNNLHFLQQQQQQSQPRPKPTKNSQQKKLQLNAESSVNHHPSSENQPQAKIQKRSIEKLKQNKRKYNQTSNTATNEDLQPKKLLKQERDEIKHSSSPSGKIFKNTNSSFNLGKKKKVQIEDNNTELQTKNDKNKQNLHGINDKNKQNLPAINVRVRQKTYLLQRGSSNDHKFNSSYYAGPKKLEKSGQANYSCHESIKEHQIDGLKQKVNYFLNKPNTQKSQLLENEKKIMQHLQAVRRQCVDSSTGIVVLNKRQEYQVKQCVRMMEAIHCKACGKTCKHLDRFYSIMSLFKIPGRKQLKLGKFTIDSGSVV